jgi:lysophospholipase L1-like esterase
MNLTLYIAKLLFAHPGRADHKKRRIACIGDSITFGAGVAQTRKEHAWTFVWNRALGDAFQVLNYGVSGATLQKEGDFPYHKVGFLKRLEKDASELILLMLGTNDAKPYNWNEKRFFREYEAMIQDLTRKSRDCRLVLMAPPRAFPDEKTGIVGYDIDPGPIEGSIRNTVFSLGEKYGLQVIDLFSLTKDHPEYFDDGVHPNAEGNRVIAGYLAEEICL